MGIEAMALLNHQGCANFSNFLGYWSPDLPFFSIFEFLVKALLTIEYFNGLS
jgi:hypothetical protein